MRGAIFDLDGTLLDSMWIWDDAADRWLAEQGKVPTPDLRQKTLRMSITEAAVYLRETFSLAQSPSDIVAEIVQFALSDYASRVKPKPGIPAFLARLRNAGVKACIATAGDHTLVEAGLAYCGIADAFCGIVTCADVGKGKDTPEVYEAALRLLGLPKAEVVVFEDAYHAAKTAKDAGFRVVGVYDVSEPEADKLRGIAELYTTDYQNLDALFDA